MEQSCDINYGGMMGTGWKTYTGIAIGIISFIVSEAFGVEVKTYTDWGQVMGVFLALFGIRHRLDRKEKRLDG